MPRKWIQREIQSLDAGKDYERIWKLSTSYFSSAFITNFFYSLTFPDIVVPATAARPVWREDGGKVLSEATHRAVATGNFVLLLSWYGPSHPKARKEVDRVYRLHEYWATKYPEDFSDVDNYLYLITVFATQKHRILVKLGFPGLSEKEKVASHRFWKDIFDMFRTPGCTPLEGYPLCWDDMIAYQQRIEASRIQGSKQGALIAESTYDQFAYRYFPPGLRWLGRALLLSLSQPTTLQALGINPVNPLLGWVLRWFLTAYFFIMMDLLPDPTVAYWEAYEKQSHAEHEHERRKIQTLDRNFVAHFSQRHVRDIAGYKNHTQAAKAIRE
ncbi:hypothetical protein TCE0_042r15466 [Talaromyces pinophilus]|uniref:ER-bound oxygenase mpaB/mpaB'/Rubber oxygenase catalytic domain-containing protein n=1 Tax=Talaromyces pinophilus TaxID=128442 RepID=A0A6V8HJG9_TALPI|nr:hypothetical protein TCE0_042r15466 [Talaromyces pinophilus]